MPAETMKWIRCLNLAEISPGSIVGLEVEGRQVAIYQLETGEYFATDNVCTHAYALLSEGWLTGDEIECPLHGGCFDVRTGKGKCEPITDDLKTYPVRVEENAIHIGFG